MLPIRWWYKCNSSFYKTCFCYWYLKRRPSLCVEWFKHKHLILNAGKSNFVIFHRDKRKVLQRRCQPVIDVDSIDRRFEATFLGVILDVSLKLKKHAISVVGRFTKYVPLIYRLNFYLSEISLKKFIIAWYTQIWSLAWAVEVETDWAHYILLKCCISG